MSVLLLFLSRTPNVIEPNYINNLEALGRNTFGNPESHL